MIDLCLMELANGLFRNLLHSKYCIWREYSLKMPYSLAGKYEKF